MHARTTHRTLVSREPVLEQSLETGASRSISVVPQRLHVPLGKDNDVSPAHATPGGVEQSSQRPELHDGRTRPLPKPLAEEDMLEGPEEASDASTSDSPIPDSELFHIPEQLQKAGLPSEAFIYVYDLPSRSHPSTLQDTPRDKQLKRLF